MKSKSTIPRTEYCMIPGRCFKSDKIYDYFQVLGKYGMYMVPRIISIASIEITAPASLALISPLFLCEGSSSDIWEPKKLVARSCANLNIS